MAKPYLFKNMNGTVLQEVQALHAVLMCLPLPMHGFEQQSLAI